MWLKSALRRWASRVVCSMFGKWFSLCVTFPAAAWAGDLVTIPFQTITGTATSLAEYEGKVILVVNTASKCGLTRQYAGLQKLHEKYQHRGFTVLAFPCNDFGKQEPGGAAEIQEFCSTKFQVSFPLMEKIHVKGENQHALYKVLTGTEGAFPGDVKWNFGKFLIGRDGKPIARFEPRQQPDSKELVDAVEKALEAMP
jgi:glutathione peroxidase